MSGSLFRLLGNWVIVHVHVYVHVHTAGGGAV